MNAVNQISGLCPPQGRLRMGVRQQANDTLDVYFYNDISAAYFDFWTNEENESSSDYLRRRLEENPNAKTINVFINSMGGDVVEGTAIANLLRRNPAQVNVTIDGFACSVASVIALAGDFVQMPRNAVMMIHNMWTVCVGNAADLRETADVLDRLMEANRTIYLDRAGDRLTEEKLIEMLDAETYLNAEECLELGFIDEIMHEKADTEPEEVFERMMNQKQATLESYRDLLREVNQLRRDLHRESEEPVVESAPEPEAKTEPPTAANFLDTFFN